MILNFDALANGDVLKTDLCIIGAGAAGLSIAREFAGHSTDVIMLESGEINVDDVYEDLNEGEVNGRSFLGLRGGRRRGFGGTTSAWGGQCCALDAEDFLEREWIPNSGWPITRDELEPFYRRAEHIFGVSGERYDETNWERFGIRPVHLDRTRLRTTVSVFSPRPRLGKAYRRLLASARNVRVILGGTATNIKTNDNASMATCIDVMGLHGKSAQISARAFILCTGTIESARLLLVSRDVAPNGLGNDNDLVGRYFQDHPTSHTARVVPLDIRRLQDLYGLLYRGRTWYWPKFALAPERQRESHVQNASACMMFEYNSAALELLREMVRTTRTGGNFTYSADRIRTLLRDIPSVFDAAYRRYILGRSPRAKPSTINLMCTIEQSANPASRVTLSDARDSLGMQRVSVDWRIIESDLNAFRVMTTSVDEELRRLGLGEVVPYPWLASNDASEWRLWDNYHQTGTTRMSADPRLGVVNVNCKVHGIDGLYVAGAPTFPTSGYANPALTISAMSIRLSDHLKHSVF